MNAQTPGSAPQEVTTLLRTKLVAPLPPIGMVDRPDLVRRLAGWGGKLVLLSAPAGWGKSSLLAAWHEHQKADRRFAFLRLEAADDEPAGFWLYAIESLRTVFADIAAGAESLLRSPDVDPIRQVIPTVVNELNDRAESAVLVLDDFHLVSDGGVSESLAYFIEHLPSGVQVVISTRSDPGLRLSTMRAAGDVLEIRAHDLGFDISDARRFLDQRFGLELETEAVGRLRDLTEGWPAALQLAGLSMQNASDPSSFVDRFAGDDRNVAAYLVGEVLASVPSDVRDFLRATCVLGELSGSLCDAVTETQGSDVLLQRLEQSGLPVIALDTHRGWYRYHHLFADWLRHELQRGHIDRIPVLHRRAADWHAEQGDLVSAIEHCFSGGDERRALELLERYLSDWEAVQWPRVLRWMARVDEESAHKYPMIAVANVWFGLYAGDFARGMRWLSVAEASIDSVPEDSRVTIRRYFQLFKGLAELAAGGDMDEARRLAAEVADAERSNPSHLYVAAVGNVAVATFWTLGPLEAVPLLMEAQAGRTNASLADAGLTPLMALAHSELGSWAEAEAAIGLSFELPKPPPYFKYPALMLAHFAAGRVLIAQGQREAAIARIEQGLELARAWPDPIGVAYGLLVMVDARSDFQEKRALVREARKLVSGKWGRGRILNLVAAAERKLDVRKPIGETEGTVFAEELTEREAEVLRLLRGDLSQREIASQLYISHNTIKGYTKSIYRKLGVSSRAGAIAAARELDLI